MEKTASENILELKNISKSFPGVKALSDVSFAIRRGEIHVIAGENGAGKSTLMKILSGSYQRDGGEIVVDGISIENNSIRSAEEHGIAIIYQELNLMRNLTVAENLFVGRHPLKSGTVDWRKMRSDAEALLKKLAIPIADVNARVRTLSIAQQQMIEIAKAVSRDVKLVIMDEPTSSLTAKETDMLFNIMRDLKARGVAVIFITHRLDEIFTISDSITVMRDGTHIATVRTADIDKPRLIEMMVGREMKQQFPQREHRAMNEVCLKVEGLSNGGKIRDISFNLQKGEVLGFTGLVGAGRTEIMRLLFGVDRKTAGTITKDGKVINIRNPGDSVKNGFAFITEDRKSEGLFMSMSISRNIVMASLDKIKKWFMLNKKLEKYIAQKFVDSLRIVTPNVDQKVCFLSGGNQQKTIVARWLNTNADIIIMDEPTRGIDVGAKREIYEVINSLVAQGKAIIVISSEMEEIMGICDRIIVIHEGCIAGELAREEFSQKTISEYAIGGKEYVPFV